MRRPTLTTTITAIISLAAITGCAGTPLYPPRPPATPGPAIADPTPSRVVLHATITGEGLQHTLDQTLPRTGNGTFHLSGERKFTWQRSGLTLRFNGRQVDVASKVAGTAELPILGVQHFPLDLRVLAEPVVSSDYRARLQSVAVTVTSEDVRLKAAAMAGVLDKIRDQIQAQVEGFTYDLKPMLTEAHARIARPLPLPLGDAQGCAELRVTGLEAAPTVFADGMEKDFAMLVAPSVTLPCAAEGAVAVMPPLANVAALPTGPFTVTVPIAARYEELAKAMSLAFTDGKLYFSKEFPELYMTDPEVYSSGDQLVLKLRIAGQVKKGMTLKLDGDIYFAGHPQVVDNELRVPDLQPTVETSNFLLKLKAALDGESIKKQARDALRLDLGERLRAARGKLSTDLGFMSGQGCLKSDVSRIEVTSVHPHASYLRLYVNITAQASVYLPCPTPVATQPQ